MGGREHPSEIEGPVGLEVFGILQAENEPWLADCFVPPADFDLMGGMQSIVVFGAPGSGKSAVREMLLRKNRDPSGRPYCLVARWQPMPSVPVSATGFQSVPGQVSYVLDACAMAIVEHLASYPDVWDRTPGWVQRLLIWFVHRFVQGNLAARAGLFLEHQRGLSSEAVEGLLCAEPDDDLLPPHNWPLVTAELSKAMNHLGLDGLWVVVDGLDPWLQTQFEHTTSVLGAFFSTLPLFEQATFAYKIFLPVALQSTLAAAAGLERHRIHSHRLEWREEQLVEIVERRLALTLSEQPFGLENLCSTSELLEWLKIWGGNRPRAWLELVRPLAAYYLSQALNRPIEDKLWKKLRQQSPPRLFVDEANRRAIVGGREVSAAEITSGGYRLLCYLFRNAGRVVSWEELYFRGYRGLDHVPRTSDDEDYEPPALYERTLHSRMSDLRKAIEPDPQHPIYFDTVKGKGVRLQVSW
ncbi:MAG: winged helix-turn-helix domain-containing protein [Chloroflexota bacterium]|nr:winged helix-turn-helix domain-containing protein [Chloroflexota bacterium]